MGIGSAPNSWFMRKAAEAGRGTFTTISALHEVNEKMERLFRKVEQPQVKDISVQWPGNVAGESYPDTVPDLYAGEPIMVRTRLADTFNGNAPVTIRGISTAGSWDAELDWEVGEPRLGIAALWARAKIEDLMDRQRQGRTEDETRAAVVAVALKHHLVSKVHKPRSGRQDTGAPGQYVAREGAGAESHAIRAKHDRDLRYDGDGNQCRYLPDEWRVADVDWLAAIYLSQVLEVR